MAVVLAAWLAPTPGVLGFSTVVVDAGHGGDDRGGMRGVRIPEKMLALDMAERVDRLLRASGYKTVMTRTSDRFVSLPDRVRVANAQDDAVFVSLHFNASHNPDAFGIETFHHSASGRLLAARIQDNLMRACRTIDRGVKRRGFYVLRHTRIPAVLVECGFLTNRTEAARCLDARYRQTLAIQIVRGIMDSDPTPGGRPRDAKRLASATGGTSPSARIVPNDQPRSPEPRVVTRAPSGQDRVPLHNLSQRELRKLFLEARAK